MNGTRGLVGATATSLVVMVELRPEQGQWCRRKSKVSWNAKGNPKIQRHRPAGLGHALVRYSKILDRFVTNQFTQKFYFFLLLSRLRMAWLELMEPLQPFLWKRKSDENQEHETGIVWRERM